MAGVANEDLANRLRHVAGSLAVDFGDELAPAHVEQLVFESADELLREARVSDFVPILAGRQARRLARDLVERGRSRLG